MSQPKFHNLSSEQIVDQLGRLDANRKFIAEQVDELKAELKARGVAAVTGNDYILTVTETVSRTLDTDKVKELLGGEVHLYQRGTASTRFNIKPVLKLVEAA